MIEVRHLRKSYGGTVALDDVSFAVETGSICGLLGPNGAGKSTTMNIMTACLAAGSGEVLYDGLEIYADMKAVKRGIGYLPEQPPLYTDMTVEEYLMFVGRAKGLSRDDAAYGCLEVCNVCGLADAAPRLIKNLSKGYRQRVGIAQALMGDPRVVILDEPTVGLDPIQIIEIRELIRKMAHERTVVVSSHILSEIRALFSRSIQGARRTFSKEHLRELFTQRSFKAGGYTAFSCMLAIAIAAAAVVAVDSPPASYTKLDISQDRTTSLSDESEERLAALEDGVTIYFVCESGNEDDYVSLLLEKYDAASGKVSVVERVPILYPAFTSQYTSEELDDNSLIVTCGDDYRVIPYSDLYALDSATYSYDFDGDGIGTVIILDCYLQQQSMFTMLRIGLATSLACIAMVLLLLIPLSKRVVRPFERNLERQRRFVTDASHELKTPLSIISANTDLTERLSGETQWTRSTKTQIARLSTLVGDLVDTARASESQAQGDLPEVNLSLMAERIVEDFRPLAEASGKRLDARIEGGILAKGDERSLQRLLNLLLDNAVKYCDEGGGVQVSLESRRRHAVLRIANPASQLSSDELPRIFDRFYRTDESRSRETGGYGIGLSAARGIVEGHGGKLVAKKDGGDAVFTATLRRR